METQYKIRKNKSKQCYEKAVCMYFMSEIRKSRKGLEIDSKYTDNRIDGGFFSEMRVHRLFYSVQTKL